MIELRLTNKEINMKIKASNATVQQLDYLVANIEGHHGSSIYSPSTNWAQGGVIIGKAHISLISPMCTLSMYWTADIGHENKYTHFAHDPLIAAMRCYVVFKLGNDVYVPDCII